MAGAGPVRRGPGARDARPSRPRPRRVRRPGPEAGAGQRRVAPARGRPTHLEGKLKIGKIGRKPLSAMFTKPNWKLSMRSVMLMNPIWAVELRETLIPPRSTFVAPSA